jgi:phytoene dehydrogenase-like protein
MTTVYEEMGRVGLPMQVTELAAREWDAVIVGGGHNGLTAAAYLARAGKTVLVLERREQLGGACTLEHPFTDGGYTVSPCAYVVGLLDPKVIDELNLAKYGYKVFVADPQLWCPFDDGTSYSQWMDHDHTVTEMKANGFSDADIQGQFAYEDLFDRIRVALREGPRDAWEGDSPDRAELEEMLGHDQRMIDVMFDASIADVVEEHVKDERLRTALYGQGVIGAWAGPRDPGTASIKFMHFAGTIDGDAGVWGYVEGGMGRVSFAIAEAARDAGAVLAAGVPVTEILPGEGVRLEGGELIRAGAVVSNADPKRTLALVNDGGVPAPYRARIDGWRMDSPVVKLNCGLSRLPRWAAVPDDDWPNRGVISVTTGMDDAQRAFENCRRGIVDPGFAELYLQSTYDQTVAPPGKHTLSAFVQYAPYRLAEGTWDGRRDKIGKLILDRVARFAPDIHDCVDHAEVLGPPDIEARIGLTKGHIFQGETMPDQMWADRLTPRTPIPGVYLCGAATHPAGSVIALNGRNAAMALLADARV